MGSRRSIAGILIAGLALLLATLAGGLTGSASSATAAPTDITFTASLNGAQEVPPTGSAGTGSATVVLNATEDMITVNGSFSNLGYPATAAHIHGPAAAGATAPPIFTLTLSGSTTSGTIMQQTFLINSVQVAQLKGGLHYVNIHTTFYPDGEIRGQLAGPTAVRILNATAARTPRGVLVRWRTATETQTLGFNVYRQQRGKLMKLNRTLIRSVFGGTANGHAYSWLDRSAPNGRVSYRLQAVRLDGTRAWVASASA